MAPTRPALLERAHRPALLSALAQLDRAVLVEPDGRLSQLNVGLVPSAAARGTVPAVRGTRHTSARRFSFDEPRSVVAVVSQDGGVTVFSDGAAIELARAAPTRPSAGFGDDRSVGERVQACLRCDRPVVLEEAGPAADGDGWVACPVCGNPIDTGGEKARAAGVRKILA